MKLLLHTRFYPNTGGIETVASLLAHEWIAAGVNVSVVTDVAADANRQMRFPFPVYHCPSAMQFLQLVRAHDVFIHFNVSVRAIWPLLFVRRPFIAVHHGFYVINESGHRDLRENVKLFIAQRATENIAVSESVARTIGINCKIIANPFERKFFQDGKQQDRGGDLVFLGRLVSSKGVAVLIRALKLLKNRNLTPHLTIIGNGPERPLLEKLIRNLQLKDQVGFTGAIATAKVAELLRMHKIMVVPSVWNEGFGVVALEGIACGCVVVGSSGGGLPEALGPCGLTFPNGDVTALADRLEQLLKNDQLAKELLSHADSHLEKHRPERIAQEYLRVICTATGSC